MDQLDLFITLLLRRSIRNKMVAWSFGLGNGSPMATNVVVVVVLVLVVIRFSIP